MLAIGRRAAIAAKYRFPAVSDCGRQPVGSLSDFFRKCIGHQILEIGRIPKRLFYLVGIPKVILSYGSAEYLNK